MIQTAILISGLAAIWLATHQCPKHQRYACLFGLAGQPFWIVSAYTTEQWGILVLAIMHVIVWASSFHRHWLNTIKSNNIKKQ